MELRALVVDHDAASARAIQGHLKKLPDVTGEAVKAADAAERVRSGGAALAFLDADWTGGDALALLKELKRADPDLEVVLVAKSPTMEMAIRATKAGAGDCVAKPMRPEQVALAVDRARRVRKLLEENRRLREQLRDRAPVHGLVGTSPAMARLQEVVAAAAAAPGGVLVMGEAGTERDAVARAIHDAGPRAKEPFAAVDATTASPEAFDAARGKAGKGTLFVDNVEALPAELQEALARPGPARVTGGSAANLLERVGRGLFRRPLLDLLSASTVALPPLRERLDDLPLWVDAHLRRRAAAKKRAPRAAGADTLAALAAYDWPGNVRELEQALDRACELGAGDSLDRGHLPPAVLQAATSVRKAESPSKGTQSLKEMESEIIARLLSEHRGDTDAVSRILKIDRSTLYRKIKRYGIDLGDLKPE